MLIEREKRERRGREWEREQVKDPSDATFLGRLRERLRESGRVK